MANYKTLTYGTTGEDVKKLQQSLNDRGANLDVDGIYGEKTRSAVRSYQQSNGLMVDGIAGSETLGHLYGTGLANTQDTQATTSWVSGTGLDPAVATISRIAGTPAVATQAVTPQVSTQRTPEQAWQDYLNREVFSYDPETDPLYQSYRKQYTDAGRLAMEDTVGMASTLTGGYGNSYAQTAGQQTYNAYLQQLSSLMPELYGAAYDRYRAEGEDLYNDIVLTEQRRENAYNKLVSLMSLGYDPTDEELTAAGLTRPQANTLRSHYTPTDTPTYTPTYSGGKTGYDNGGYSDAVVRLAQDYFGVTADGMWGPNSTKAGGSIDRAVATMLEKGETKRTLQIYNKVGSESDWAARGVGTDNYLAIAEQAMADANRGDKGLSKEEYFYLAYRFGLV